MVAGRSREQAAAQQGDSTAGSSAAGEAKPAGRSREQAAGMESDESLSNGTPSNGVGEGASRPFAPFWGPLWMLHLSAKPYRRAPPPPYISNLDFRIDFFSRVSAIGRASAL